MTAERHTIRCVHCDGTRREVSLWNQIVELGDTVCCWLSTITPPARKRGTR